MTKKELEKEIREFIDSLKADKFSDMAKIKRAAIELEDRINTKENKNYEDIDFKTLDE